MDLRCSAASLADGEPLAGTAPTEGSWLFVEVPGSWGRQAVAESRLPDEVREHLMGLSGVRVQLVRRHGREGAAVDRPAGTRVFAATLAPADDRPVVRSTVLARVEDLVTLETETLPAYDGPLWLVCTNGRRDVCCAELGRPVAEALAMRWPEATWETTHLGGHRFSGTLLALPSGMVLGRLAPESAVAACADLLAGRVPVAVSRGRAGLSAQEQVAELHLRSEHGVGDVAVQGSSDEGVGTVVRLSADGEAWEVVVVTAQGTPHRQSCADDRRKPAAVHTVVSARKHRASA